MIPRPFRTKSRIFLFYFILFFYLLSSVETYLLRMRKNRHVFFLTLNVFSVPSSQVQSWFIRAYYQFAMFLLKWHSPTELNRWGGIIVPKYLLNWWVDWKKNKKKGKKKTQIIHDDIISECTCMEEQLNKIRLILY